MGLGAAMAVAQLLKSRLYGLSAFDPAIYALAAAALVLVSVLAALTPARTATHIDAMVALRAE